MIFIARGKVIPMSVVGTPMTAKMMTNWTALKALKDMWKS
jgi:hypothetical protein